MREASKSTITTPNGTNVETEADTFTYLGPPTVVTEQAVSVETNSAYLAGSVDPELTKITSCFFEWGTTSEYGQDTVGCGPGDGEGEGSAPEHVSAHLKGLTRGTTYHYRLVAANELGTTYGEDRSLHHQNQRTPGLGRCVQLAQAEGEFSDEGCTAQSGGQDGGYGWEAGPGARPISAGAPRSRSSRPRRVRCSAAKR